MKLLINAGINLNQVNNYGDSALIIAASEGHKEICELLINNGINVNHINNEGKTALDYAIENGHNEIRDYLQNYIQV